MRGSFAFLVAVSRCALSTFIEEDIGESASDCTIETADSIFPLSSSGGPRSAERFTELGHPSSGGLGTTVLGERTSTLGASNSWRPWEGNPLGWGEETLSMSELSGVPLDERLVG